MITRQQALVLMFVLTLAVSAQAVETYDIDYLPGQDYADNKDKLDVYMPEAAEAVPVVVYFHGGALRMGSKEDARTVVTRLNARGIGVVSVNYRLSPGVRHPAHVEDAAAATAWVFKHIADYGGDAGRIYLSGHSAGAYLAVLLTLDDRHLRAHGVASANIKGTLPISPFLYVEETAADRPKDVWGKDPRDWLAASVTPHIGKGKPPMLLIYADGDDDWRKQQNERFELAMRALANDVRAEQVPQRDHMTLIYEINRQDDQIGDMLVDFIAAHP